ncbi:cell death abnormality protein 1-like isoform X2 [Saccostrea cucullata]|uniref:cell death abnormality protein 1-like isoform X2 n=1 Tax=Saccostrea cuccullata TaxID=36930 RepID=UPI002ED081C4
MRFSDSKWIYFLVILRFCMIATEEIGGSTCCQKTYPQKRCVYNYFLDFDKTCKECPPGTYGLNCSQKCPSSTYGQFCSKLCQCPPDRCDRTHGCEDIVLEKEENSGLCVSKDGEIQCCLSFYKTNNTCKAGTYNNNCSDPCPPGYYGELCSKVCDCPKASCDKVQGCIQQASVTEVPLNMIIFAGSITLVFLLIMTILIRKYSKIQSLRRHAPVSNDLTAMDVAVYSEVKD